MEKKAIFQKSRIYPLVLILAMFVTWKSCRQQEPLLSFRGSTMGTTYTVIYGGEKDQVTSVAIDSLLKREVAIFSTYEQASEISRLNQSKSAVSISDEFEEVIKLSKTVYKKTDGAFDPTVMPLVNFWGFGYEKGSDAIDSIKVDSLRAFVGFDKIVLSDGALIKKDDRVQLDLSAVAKGYAVDKLAEYIKSKGVTEFYVEIGGEVRVGDGVVRIRIQDPRKEQGAEIDTFNIKNLAVATSGNYRNISKVGDKFFGHTINPKTGFPEQTEVISSTVIARTCAEADAYATAFMVMGLKKGKKVCEDLANIEVMLIYTDDDGELRKFETSGINKLRGDGEE